MERKKILHLITGLGVGGTEMMLFKTLPLMQDKFDNRVCCIMGHGPIGKELEKKGVVVYYLNLRSILFLRSILRFKKVIEEFKPDILTTYLIHADLSGRIFGKLFGIKRIVCSQRGSLLQWEFLRFFDKLTKCLVTAYVVQTNYAKEELMKKLNLPKKRITIIPNSIDISEYEFALDEKKKKNELRIDPDNLNIVCVSNLRRGKGHEYLLEVFEEVYQKNKKLNLLIVGDGEEKEKLIRQIENYASANNIHFLGNRNDVKEILRISDIFVLLTLAEGMSNAILEAMASKLPIVTTNITANIQIIENDKTGILLPIKNSKAIKEVVLALSNNSGLRKELGENAKKIVEEKFEIKKVIEITSNFYKSI